MSIFGLFFVITGVVILIYPDILAIVIGLCFLFFGIFLITNQSRRGPSGVSESFRVGGYEFFKRKK